MRRVSFGNDQALDNLASNFVLFSSSFWSLSIPHESIKNLGFLIFRGDIEKHQQHEMGSKGLLPKLLF